MRADDPLALVYDFHVDLTRFAEATEAELTALVQEAASTAGEAIVVGNQFGPGVPVDTGFARASFRVGINDAVDGPASPPTAPSGRAPGTTLYTDAFDVSPVMGAKLGDTIYITTPTEYAQYLEFEPKTRRYGPRAGSSTVFIDPVVARFPQIVDDAADRVGFGGR